MLKISIITPAYNAAHTIRRCIESIQQQTYLNWELIIIDDGSSDQTFSIASEYATLDKRIIVLTQNNAGPGMARNKGLDIIRSNDSDYISFIDSDDYVDRDFLLLVTNKILETKGDIIVLDNYFETPKGHVLREERLSKFASLSKTEIIANQMTGKMPWGGCRKIFRKTIIIENDIKYTSDAVGEEALFSFQALYHSSKIEFLGKCVYHYVDQPYSQSKKGLDDPWGNVVKKMESFLLKNNLHKEFQLQLNSFSITALIVSFYRISLNHSFVLARKIILNQLKENDVLNISFDKRCMELKTLVIYYFAKFHMVSVIVFLSKFKNKLILTNN